MSPEWLGAIGLALGSLLTYLGVRYTARQSRQAADAGVEAQRDRDAVDGFDRLAGRLEKRIESLEGRVGQLELQLSIAQRLLRSAIGYVERLLDYISEHMPGQPDVPQAPPDLSEHLSASVLENWRVPPADHDFPTPDLGG